MKRSTKGGDGAKEPARGSEQEPTKAELAVLQILWQWGPQTVRAVHELLNDAKEDHDVVQYTSTLKLMQVMTEKGMLERDESNMRHVYRAAVEEGGTKNRLLKRFVDTMYNGSVSNMMVALLGNERTSAEDLEKLKDILRDMERKSNDK